MRAIAERIEGIQTELAEIKTNLVLIEDKVEAGLKLVADEAEVDAQIQKEVGRLIENTHELNPIFISVLDGASYFSGKVLAELRKHNQLMWNNRCGLLKLSPGEKELEYDHVKKLKTTPYCIVSYNSELYFARNDLPMMSNAHKLLKLDIALLGASLSAVLKEALSAIGFDECKKVNKKTHNVIATKMRDLSFDTSIQYEHTAMRTRSYEGVEQKEMKIDSFPKGELGGEYVIVLDDVADRGETAKAIKHYLQSVGVQDDVLFVLVDKVTADRECNPSYRCILTLPTAFLVGGGMDLYTGRFREKPDVWAVDPDTLPSKEQLNSLLARRKQLNIELRECIKQQKEMAEQRASSPSAQGGMFSSRGSSPAPQEESEQEEHAMGHCH